ncbi:hypothetical protein Ga0123461_0788 [Mariprofundus aestuarium]|uniref:PilZ domain-containing protein n=1 Tax=Mariprofundus aestuarium TaxID=1921086 RepID=A0A2K8KWH2_MARES|nr:hypothetical protein [Mariprofundus aestuarium]ATX79208.1 hypothetical protein Ga0123461_0788 [Mariprofundus aestuarium]
MEKERRNCLRHSSELQPKGELSLTIDGHPTSILEVQNISPFGMALLVDGHVNNGLEVGLRYIHGTSNIEVFGTVAWNSIAESESQESSVGIYFRKQDISLNTAFFKAITA